MQIEKLKGQVNSNPVLSKLMMGPNWLMKQVKAPSKFRQSDFPGSWTAPRD